MTLRKYLLLLTEAIELGVLKYHTCVCDNMRVCKLQKRRTTILSSVGLSNNKIKTLRFFQADLFCCFTTGYFFNKHCIRVAKGKISYINTVSRHLGPALSLTKIFFSQPNHLTHSCFHSPCWYRILLYSVYLTTLRSYLTAAPIRMLHYSIPKANNSLCEAKQTQDSLNHVSM